ncbi:hypothetical protein [Halomonas sp. LBP4]|uniref:hypothetical protein n=1 Tax=Halomonas sp. LBP4 TaxID=2044917 RepID=UPI000D756487|nr:hypothetical protein [Halomonas sp. LBP4]PXX94715.1 hypothetical protein CR157_21005 [Halomonas sp. LBP4]
MSKSEFPKVSEEQFHRLVYSNWDFQQALSALTFLMEDCDLNEKYNKVDLRRFKCYENQVIISFCRPFSPSRSGVHLSLKLIDVRLTEAEKEIKDRLLYLRNKIVAHSDSEEMHYKGVTIDLGEDVNFQAPLFIYDEGLGLSTHDHETLELLLKRLMRGIAATLFSLCRNDPERFDTYKKPRSFREQSG